MKVRRKNVTNLRKLFIKPLYANTLNANTLNTNRNEKHKYVKREEDGHQGRGLNEAFV